MENGVLVKIHFASHYFLETSVQMFGVHLLSESSALVRIHLETLVQIHLETLVRIHIEILCESLVLAHLGYSWSLTLVYC